MRRFSQRQAQAALGRGSGSSRYSPETLTAAPWNDSWPDQAPRASGVGETVLMYDSTSSGALAYLEAAGEMADLGAVGIAWLTAA